MCFLSVMKLVWCIRKLSSAYAQIKVRIGFIENGKNRFLLAEQL